MDANQPIIDFKELHSPVRGEGLEQLTRLLGKKRGLDPSWSGRGPDGGRDMLFSETTSDAVRKRPIKWVVSCKDKATSGAAVTEQDLPSVRDKVEQHSAQGFLLVTTTTVGVAAKALLDSLDFSNGGHIHTAFWESTELTAMLLDPDYEDILKQCIPRSWSRKQSFRTFGELEGRVPAGVLSLIARSTETDQPLTGSAIWPGDEDTALLIDHIIVQLGASGDIDGAVPLFDRLPSEALAPTLDAIHAVDSDLCYNACRAIVLGTEDYALRLNAFQFIGDTYEVHPGEVVQLAARLHPEDLQTVYAVEVAASVEDTLVHSASQYAFWRRISTMSSDASVLYAAAYDVQFKARDDRSIGFSGDGEIEAELSLQTGGPGRWCIPVSFEGYFDEHGIYVTDSDVNPNYDWNEEVDDYSDDD